MDDAAPAPRYYTSLVGAWEGRFRIRITSRPELARLSLAPRFLGNAAHLAGAMSMKTTLEGAGRSFRHTTHVSAFGLEQFTTDETIELDSDGRTFRMSGVQRHDPGVRGARAQSVLRDPGKASAQHHADGSRRRRCRREGLPGLGGAMASPEGA